MVNCISSSCSATVVEESFNYLDAPIERIAGADVPTPYAANLERMAFPQVCFTTLTYYIIFAMTVYCHHRTGACQKFGYLAFNLQ